MLSHEARGYVYLVFMSCGMYLATQLYRVQRCCSAGCEIRATGSVREEKWLILIIESNGRRLVWGKPIDVASLHFYNTADSRVVNV